MLKCAVTKEQIDKVSKQLQDLLKQQTTKYLKANGSMDQDCQFSMNNEKVKIAVKKIDSRVIVDYENLVKNEMCEECDKALSIQHVEFILEEEPGIVDKVKSFFGGK